MDCVNILEILVKNDFNLKSIEDIKDNVCLNIITKNFDLCIDYNIAQTITDYQNMIYTVYCYGKYSCADLRKLTLDEKTRLCLKFRIEKGSTDYLANAKEIIGMFIQSLPEPHRIWGVLAICITISGCFGGYLYYRHCENNADQATTQLVLTQNTETTRLAINKLAELAHDNVIARKAVEYAMEQERKAAKNFEAAGGDIVINGEIYTQEYIAKIVKDYSRHIYKQPKTPTSKNVTERYVVTNIETKAPYRLTLENNGKIIRPTYNPDFLDDDMLTEVQQSVKSSVPVQFDFDINITTDEKGKQTLSIIKINKIKP